MLNAWHEWHSLTLWTRRCLGKAFRTVRKWLDRKKCQQKCLRQVVPFSSPSVIYVSILNRTKEKVEGKIRLWLFIRFTLRDVTEDKSSLLLSHRSRKASDSLQQVHSGIPRRTLHAKENHLLQASYQDAAHGVPQPEAGAIRWGDLLPAWHCPVAPQGSRPETNTADTMHLCTAVLGEMGFVRDAVFFNRVNLKRHLCLLPRLWVFRVLWAPARWGANLPVCSFIPYECTVPALSHMLI